MHAVHEGGNFLRGVRNTGYDKTPTFQGFFEISCGDPIVFNDQNTQSIGGQVVHSELAERRRGTTKR